MDRVNVLVEAKKEYTSQLQKILTPRLYEGFKSIYEDIIEILNKELEVNKTQSTSLIKEFQKTLKEIPQWNHDMVINEYNRIEKISNCDYLEDLIEAIFITNTKILTSVQINDDKPTNIKISVPQPSHFIHKCYMECAKEIYKNPYIFDQSRNVAPKEKHNNLRELLSIIDNGINNSIRELLPIRDILKQGITKIINNKNNKEITKESISNETTEDEDEEDEEKDEENDEENDEEKDEEKDEEIDVTNTNEENKPIVLNDSVINEVNTINIENEKNDDLYKPDLINQNNEIKEIILSKNPILNIKKFENIEKINNLNYDEIKDNEIKDNEVNHDKTLFNTIANNNSALKNNDDVSESGIMYKKVIKQNPFIKTVKNNKFIKNRLISGGNNSFYKKKYEENSANYNSINTLEVKEPSILKNQIILDARSDDEEEVELDI